MKAKIVLPSYSIPGQMNGIVDWLLHHFDPTNFDFTLQHPNHFAFQLQLLELSVTQHHHLMCDLHLAEGQKKRAIQQSVHQTNP